MIGKLVAGLICGVAAAIPGKFMLTSLLGGLVPLMGPSADTDLALAVAPFAVAAMVIFVCAIAPNATGAWLRGCLIAAAVCAVVSFQALQCFGFDWFFGDVLRDPASRRAAMVGCPEGLTPLVSALIVAGCVIFGLAGVLLWRGARRGGDL